MYLAISAADRCGMAVPIGPSDRLDIRPFAYGTESLGGGVDMSLLATK